MKLWLTHQFLQAPEVLHPLELQTLPPFPVPPCDPGQKTLIEPSSVPPSHRRPSENLGHFKGVDYHSKKWGARRGLG